MSRVIPLRAPQSTVGGVTIRHARPTDVNAVFQLGMEALMRDPYPGMRVSAAKVRSLANEVISGAGNCCLVAERDGEVIGAVSAVVQECMVYEKRQATVVQFYCTVPGVGARIIREFLTWARSRPAIKAIVFTLEVQADPRIGKLLRRLGLNEELPVYMQVL